MPTDSSKLSEDITEKVVTTTCSSHCGGTCPLQLHVKNGVITGGLSHAKQPSCGKWAAPSIGAMRAGISLALKTTPTRRVGSAQWNPEFRWTLSRRHLNKT